MEQILLRGVKGAHDERLTAVRHNTAENYNFNPCPAGFIPDIQLVSSVVDLHFLAGDVDIVI